MRLLKRTYSLPAETVERFERSVAAGNRSSLVSQLVDAESRWSLEDRSRPRAHL